MLLWVGEKVLLKFIIIVLVFEFIVWCSMFRLDVFIISLVWCFCRLFGMVVVWVVVRMEFVCVGGFFGSLV